MLGLLVSAGYASATPPGDPAAQALGQAAASGQAAGALSGASQSQPANQNISVRRPEPRQRRQRLAIEHRQLERHGREREPHRPVGRTDPERLVRMRGRNASDRPVRGQQPVRTGTVVRHAEWCEQHEHPSPGPEPGETMVRFRSRTALSPTRPLRTRTQRARPPTRARPADRVRRQSDSRRTTSRMPPQRRVPASRARRTRTSLFAFSATATTAPLTSQTASIHLQRRRT